ncbi:replication protein A subunit RPA32 [Wolfiporia cocos MD-104 SS10]|uniref:Replication protein A subunit RPA32 n=1 Tax=Wolfiporia cocos (strain MD-104) TaxID=742152 RepID=A0A2H3J6Y5_WOLCO|nr:replication protein A subunit RPA32 [Wolfiporia cocos MD-104 SS10]
MNDGTFYGGGGGFLAGGSPFGSGSGSPGGGQRRGAAAQSLRPTTIKQLLNATQMHSEADWTINDIEVGQVSVVAQVISVQVQTTNCQYVLDDGTGQLQARKWVEADNENEEEKTGGIIENTYVRVLGNLKFFNNRKQINATHILPVKDPHEAQFHILEAATVTIALEKGLPRPGEQKPAVANGHANSSAYTAQSHTGAMNSQFAHLPELQRRIVEFIMSQPAKEEGVHVGAIARAVGGQAHAISEALDRLMDEGHVFTTIDDSHFKVSI